MTRWRRAAVVAYAVLGAGAPAAGAAPYEPNDSLVQAAGPLTGGTTYEAAKETTNDPDFFFFNTAGQRQLDISLHRVAGNCDHAELLDPNGRAITSKYFGAVGQITHLLWTAASRQQVVFRVYGSQGCVYRFRIDPPDAVTTADPGTVVTLSGSGQGADDVQRILLDGQLVGQTQGTTTQSFSLGELAPASRLTFEAHNQGGGHAWNVDITNHAARTLTTLFKEQHDGYGDDGERVGLVRRAVLTASGSPLESCGEAFAPLTCIPIDRDGDGALSDTDCDDGDDDIRPGAAEVLDNAVDENCDGIANVRPRYGSTITLKRKGRTYTGRIAGGDRACTAGRRLVLRRRGKGRRSYGSLNARSTGAFTFRPARRLLGRVYVVAASKGTSKVICSTATSKTIRG